MYDSIPFFLDNNNKNYIKINSELLFFSIFSKNKDIKIDKTINTFINSFYKNKKYSSDDNLSTFLLIKIFSERKHNKKNFNDFIYDTTELNNYYFTKNEIECYMSILTNNITNKVIDYFNIEKINNIKNKISNCDELYYFTHDMFYLSYLNLNKNFFTNINNSDYIIIKEYIYSNIVYYIIIENIDLLGELIISLFLLDGKINFDNNIIRKGFLYIEQYINSIESLGINVDSESFSGFYHTLLVICMLLDCLRG